jgi:sodium-independent sulfate anion transporter 11
LFGQITAILVATPEFQNGTWSFFHITSNLSLITGIIVLAIGILRLGILFDFICQPAIGGFMAGTAITIVISQV